MTSPASYSLASAVSTDGATIAYRELGDPSARPLVLVHGWAQSSACWGPELLDELATRYRVVALDLRGHGHSTVAEAGYDSSSQWADDVEAVQERLSDHGIAVRHDGAVLRAEDPWGTLIQVGVAEN